MHYLIEIYRLPGHLVDDVSVALTVNAALVKGHDVLGEGPRLVAEHVLDLTQLLVQSRGPRFGISVGLGVVHVLVPVDQLGQEQPDHLHRDVE